MNLIDGEKQRQTFDPHKPFAEFLQEKLNVQAYTPIRDLHGVPAAYPALD